MASAGFKSRVMINSGSIAQTDYIVADSGDGLTWRGSDSHRYVWDPAVGVVVKVDGAVVDPSTYTFDYLLGLVTFNASQSGSAVRVTGTSLIMATVFTAQGWTASVSIKELDDTVLEDDAISRAGGLFDVTGTVSRLDVGQTDYDDNGARTVTIADALLNRQYKVIEHRPNTDADEVIRVWALFLQDQVTSEVADLSKAVLTYNGCVPTDNVSRSFAWGSPVPSN